jgi:HlyD family secretion protein
MKTWRILPILLLCLVLAGTAACGGKQPEAEWQPIEVVRGDLTVSVSGSGNIGVSHEASLAFGSGGKVDKVYVKEADKVSKGDVLAKLDTGALELALAQAKMTLAQAEVAREDAEYNLNQLKDVLHASYDRVRIAEAQLNAAQAQLEAAEQAVAQAQKQLDEATITAPFDGLVAGIYVKEGDIIPSPTMAPKVVVYLIDPTRMELSAEVDEIDIAGVKLGQRAVISVDALPDKQLEGVVTLVSSVPTIEAGLVQYKVKIGFDVPQGLDLKVGMSATADIIIQQRSNVLLVPVRAIERDSQGKPMVWVSINQQIEPRSIITGISDGVQTEILSGLGDGETVVVKKRASAEAPGGFLFGQ